MARRLFMKHLAEASLAVIGQIQGVHSPDEGLISCLYTHTKASEPYHVRVQLYTTNLDEYPNGNSYMLYTDDENVDPTIPQALQKVTDNSTGKTLPAILTEVSERLTAAIMCHTEEKAESESGVDNSDDFDADLEFYDSDDGEFGLGDLNYSGVAHHIGSSNTYSSKKTQVKMGKIREDLRILKAAGFRVGIFGNLATSGVLCISIRVVKLGLSDEAMQAWGLRRKHYLILLIKYSGGYIDATELAKNPYVRAGVRMRVGLCEHYKPSLHEASAFLDTVEQDGALYRPENIEKGPELEPLFIGKALNQFLEERLFVIIKSRISHGFGWLGAETFVAERQASSESAAIDDLGKYQSDDSVITRSLPGIALADHLREVPLEHVSLPLVIMQFVLRHFVRCTEFCLVCHCRLDDSFEALKPYVCTKPLCLYQYMSLGFGTSLEWEIISQPYVVDLLVSFCYAAASLGRLKDLPLGMGLVVPVPPRVVFNHPALQVHPHTTGPVPQSQGGKSFSCRWSPALNSLMVDEEHHSPDVRKLKRGDWLVLVSSQNVSAAHYRVQHVALPSISLGEPVGVDYIDTSQQTAATVQNDSLPYISGTIEAHCYVYDNHFEDLSTQEQLCAVLTLLEVLPGVGEMYQHLERQTKGRKRAAASLKSWSERIPESSVNLLRWIVASNRSCIAQVDEVSGEIKRKSSLMKEDRIGGMDLWMQFRFAQGAPDKEKRFNDCVMREAAATRTNYPTIFAWHGSRLANWHSIVRQGLHYDEVVNGRSFGNGVYLSPHAQTSLVYANPDNQTRAQWKPSMLNITKAFSLNEVVNNPAKFVSKTPHYVVSDIDWIQTRYLFVKTATGFNVDSHPLTDVYEQDPDYLARNEANQAITIPISAISKSRRPYQSIQMTPTEVGKRAKTMVGIDQATGERQEDDANSVVSDADDLAILKTSRFEEENDALGGCDETLPGCDGGATAFAAPTELATDFVPGTLDLRDIKFLEPPRDATTTSTKALMRLLRDAVTLQERSPAATLGWHIDRSLINNMYQWIVELHSFPASLPLAQDLKACGLTSIVLEMRFSNQFPFSPPFIRVVKPRFLPFAKGGGGHVTEGGAMCMEVLTNNGWSAAQSVESLLLQVRMALSDEERPARLAKGGVGGQDTYGIGEAVEAYVRACRNHGWQVPSGFDRLHLE
ncbi:hypothetical protein A1O3_06590 [Capronia epimyces CBS 606.96]|uniref:UBC core domain-containing protein n=1 Tax=Capronia epimyces CBS 606.96 TaxID=1182542 RepID=W9XZF7_9EURO|nr:uncharacterized protein A1O3_06590 [Capronia epimyces CBS 606.96]EXJ82775.1 hypothetical protein A1O3_06590 [Capronia epimyces CBS 606.96]